MRYFPHFLGALTVLISTGHAELTPDTFTSLHDQLQPAEEAWTSIPWQVSLVPAQQLAIDEGKPLFVWAMDGHPLGCT